jgi:hypothetical protein
VTSTGRYWTVRLTGHGLGVGSLRNQSPKLPPERPSFVPQWSYRSRVGARRTGAGWVLVDAALASHASRVRCAAESPLAQHPPDHSH